MEKVLDFIQSDSRLTGLRRLESPVSPEEEAIHHGHSSSSPLAAGEDAPFRWDHVRVKLKKEVLVIEYTSFICGVHFVVLSFEMVLIFSLHTFKQIVTLGMPSVLPTEKVGKYVSPRQWNELISDPDTVSNVFGILVSKYVVYLGCNQDPQTNYVFLFLS